MEYYYSESAWFYRISWFVLIFIGLIVACFIGDKKSGIALMCYFFVFIGVVVLIFSWKDGDRIWKANGNILKTPKEEIRLSEIKKVERITYNEMTYFKIYKHGGETVKIEPPFLSEGYNGLFSFLKLIEEKQSR